MSLFWGKLEAVTNFFPSGDHLLSEIQAGGESLVGKIIGGQKYLYLLGPSTVFRQGVSEDYSAN